MCKDIKKGERLTLQHTVGPGLLVKTLHVYFITLDN